MLLRLKLTDLIHYCKGNKITTKISDNPLLKSGDRINIIGVETFPEDFSTTIVGEVFRSERISISKGSSTFKKGIEKPTDFCCQPIYRELN
jgi:hypothetical protein